MSSSRWHINTASVPHVPAFLGSNCIRTRRQARALPRLIEERNQISKMTYALMQKVDPGNLVTVSVPTQNSKLKTLRAGARDESSIRRDIKGASPWLVRAYGQ